MALLLSNRAVKSGKCVPGLLPNVSGPPCHFSHLSGPTSADFSATAVSVQK